MIMAFAAGAIPLVGMIKEWNVFVSTVKNALILFRIVYEANQTLFVTVL